MPGRPLANLRIAVQALRKAVGDEAPTASRTTVGLRPEAVTVDLADCRRRTAAGDLAAAVCHSELLAGYGEDWAEATGCSPTRWPGART